MTSLTGMDVNEMDEEDLENERKKFAEEHGMEAYGRKCPDQFINNLTPMEFDELVVMFNKYDVDGSDTIDKHEARKILFDLGMDHSMEEAEKLFKIIDTDDGGELEFEEFVGFIVMLKKGDSRLAQFSNVLDNLKNTPLGALENQCKARGLKMRFITLEERPGTSQQAAAFVVELQIAGHFVSLEDGVLVDKFEVRKYQGIDETNRAAKGRAASSALLKLQAFLPGIRYKPGDMPEEWVKWSNDNLLRGVDVRTILNILVSKGFKPHYNIAMMQRIGVWLALTRFIEKNPDFEESDVSVDIRFQSWVKNILDRGVDGSILLKVLEDRGLKIEEEHPHYAQKIKNNELGIMMDFNGQAPKLLDFWQACSDGDADLVKMYCECLQDVNEEQVGRNDSIARTPLMLAAMRNQVEVLKILLDPKYKAVVRHVDRRGRTALHLAAMKGSTEACEVLLDRGARIYDAEHNGDTALHLAAYMNNPDTVDYLACKAQEFTRAITSDKILCRKGSTFTRLVEEIYEDLPKIKLTNTETLRFEKAWLKEASILFIKYMDSDVSQFLAAGNDDIQRDVLARFDPRPETGINMYNSFTAEWTFVPTIANAETLGILLGYVFRQSAIDLGNSWMRTPLHLACDGNRINSHENTIVMLIDVHGASTLMKDRYGSTPLHLLWMDRRFDGCVSATQNREEVVFNQRTEKLLLLNEELRKVEDEITDTRRNKVLIDARSITESMGDFLWNVVRESSILRTERHKYEEYVDPDTQSFFYAKIPVNPIRGDLHTEWTWFKPSTNAVPIFDRFYGIKYLTTMSSRWLRTLNGWRMYQCMRSKAIFYYHPNKDIVTFKPPRNCDLVSLHKKHRPEPDAKYGFGNEWVEMFIPVDDQEQKKKELADENGQLEYCLSTNAEGLLGYKFYRNNSTLHEFMTWDRPVDAVEIPTKLKFCSAVQNRNQPALQIYYTCEECNRNWAGVLEGKKVPRVILCEPCIFRCHVGHKGVRKVKEGKVSCVCNEVCRATSIHCRAREVSPAQLMIQQFGFEERIEWKRQTDRDEKNPYTFCPVPCCWEDGKTPKRWGGWSICRRPPYLGFDSLGAPEADVSTVSVVSTQDSVTAADSDEDADDRSEFTTQSERSRKRAERKAARELKEAQEESEIQLDFFPYLPPPGLPEGWIEVTDSEEAEDSLYLGCRVLAHKHRTGNSCLLAQTPIHEYGTILKKARPLVYLVQFDDAERRHVGRQYIEAITKKTFYVNIEKGLHAWTIEEAAEVDFHFVNHGKTQKCPLTLDVPDWIALKDRSIIRRSFENYDELEDELSGLIFYVDELVSMDDRKARIIQRNVRSWKFFPCMLPVTSKIDRIQDGGGESGILSFANSISFAGWTCTGFSSFIPDEVFEECRILNAWTYIRRRSHFVGEFNSISGEEWEEYVDSVSSEYLYWHEDSNRHQWIKPEISRAQAEADKVVYKVDDEVMFRFPGDWQDTLGIITRIRTDDETNEPMYDVCHTKKYHDRMIRDPQFEPEKWIAKHRIKKPVLDQEAAFFLKLDIQLTSNLRRTKAAEERRKKKQKQDRMNEQLAKIRDKLLAQQSEEQMEGQALIANAETNTMVKKDGKENENQLQVIHEEGGQKEVLTEKDIATRNMSAAQLLQKARLNRAKQEALDVVSEKEKKDQERRKGAVQAIVDEQKKQGGGEQLTRSEMLALQRTIDMKLKIEDRIAERNKIQDELLERQKNRQAKIDETEELLRGQEYQTTSPRSLIRRRLLRRMHVAMDRQNQNYVICEWGCGDWVKRGQDQKEHQANRCPKRIVSCAFDCGCKLSQEQWFMPVGGIVDDSDTLRLREFQAQADSTNEIAKITKGRSKYGNTIMKPRGKEYGSEMTPEEEAQTFEGMSVQQYHEQLGCRRRLTPCPLNCLEWVIWEELPHHMEETCVKRPAKKIKCRLGCDAEFGGLSEKMIEAEEERHEHEEDQCIYRIIRCAWRFDDGRQCAAQMQAKDRDEHRDYHLSLQGISTYVVAGTYVYNVPKKVTRLKVQLWGAGGGGGHFKGRKGGFGGGGAFVESIISVEPFDVLEVVVGAAGSKGQHGTEIEIKRKEFEVIGGVLRTGGADDVEVIEATDGIALGGDPGGGDGCGGGSLWAGGGGGGYSAISKRTMVGNEAFAVAGGGGGGGSIDGMPGGNMEGPLPGARIDRRNGSTATVDVGGEGGDSGSIYNTKWPAVEGVMWQGGKSSQFGGGGGGGYYGGGGGGTSPGVAGGGGGGSSYIHAPRAIDCVMVVGHGDKPGGLKHDPPEAVGLGEWDNLHKPVGHGGYADDEKVEDGCSGCVRIFKPGYY